MEELIGTIADTLMKQGYEEGKTEGRADTLRKLLERRFSALPQDAWSRINTASLAELDSWLDAVLDAVSLDEVFVSDQT